MKNAQSINKVKLTVRKTSFFMLHLLHVCYTCYTEYKTVRYLLVGSMFSDALGLLNWIAILTYSANPTTNSMARLFLVTSSLCGFISALLTALGLGLFAQAVDIFEDARLYLGWPYFAVAATTVLSIMTAFTSATKLQKAAVISKASSTKLEPNIYSSFF